MKAPGIILDRVSAKVRAAHTVLSHQTSGERRRPRKGKKPPTGAAPGRQVGQTSVTKPVIRPTAHPVNNSG